MQATGKTFVMDATFSLGDLLRVGLHQAVDACSEIIDRAQKELIIEKALKKIEDTWGALTLSFTPYQASALLGVAVLEPHICSQHEREMNTAYLLPCGGQASGVLQVTVEETATEALETDNLALQTMSGGKYVQVGSPEV